MHILQIVNSLSSGGAETFVTELSLVLKRLGHTVSVLLYAGILDERGEKLSQTLKQNSVSVTSLSIRSNIYKFSIPVLFAKHISDIRPDLVHAHLDQSAFFTFLSGFFYRNMPPRVQTIHSVHYIKSLPRRVIRTVNLSFDMNVACSTATYLQYPHDLHNHRWRLIENGISLPEVPTEQQRSAYRLKLGIQKGETVFLNIGAMENRYGVCGKAQDIIIRATRLLKGKIPIRMIFLGDGSLRRELEDLARQANVFDRMVFAGYVPDPYEYIYAADVAIMPSRFEGLPVSALECVCTGLPMISSDIQAFEVFDSKGTKRVRVDDPEGLAQAMQELAEDRLMWSQQALSLLPMYRGRFDMLSTAEQYLELYKKVAI